jgi:hypothetical protein
MTLFYSNCAAGRRVPGRCSLLMLGLAAWLLMPALAFAQTTPTWTSSDIGGASDGRTSLTSCSHALDASTCAAAAVTVRGGGIREAADQFRFVHRQLTGDGDVIVRVDALKRADGWSKAGIMIRSSLAAGSTHLSAFATAGNGVVFQGRLVTNGTHFTTDGGAGIAPVWLKLERRGSRITGFRSADGANWNQIGSQTLSLPSTVYVGLAVTSSTTARSTTANVSSLRAAVRLPAPWTAADVGNPTLKGLTTHRDGAFTVTAGGNDIFNSSDQFRFTYQQVTGDLDIVARVVSLTQADSWTKAGVMIRASLAANSAHASLFISAARGVAFQRRPNAGGSTASTAGPSSPAPGWVKLELRSDVITALWSPDGTTWSVIGNEVVDLPSTFFVGLAMTSRDAAERATGVLDNVDVTATGSNTPPMVSLSAPANGATFTGSATVTVTADADDTDGSIAAVEFFAGTTRIGTDTSEPYSVTWSGAGSGTYELTALARDDDGATTRSAPRSIIIQGTSNQRPTVSLTAPASNATYTAPASIAIAASAADTDGTITRVDFYAGTTMVGSDTTSPYTFNWTGVGAGTYSITAVARDDDGATTTSGARTVIVSNPTSTLPNRLAFTASADHASVLHYVLQFFRVGSSTSGTPVSSVDLGRPAVVGGEIELDVAAPISALPSGSYVAVVVAVGANGSSASAPSASFSR